MNGAVWRRTIRLTAFFVLLNVVLGLCACLGDTPALPGAGRGAVMTTPLHQPQVRQCGDDCDSCVCCASLVLARQIRVESVLAMTGEAPVPIPATPSDPEPHKTKRPPRA